MHKTVQNKPRAKLTCVNFLSIQANFHQVLREVQPSRGSERHFSVYFSDFNQNVKQFFREKKTLKHALQSNCTAQRIVTGH